MVFVGIEEKHIGRVLPRFGYFDFKRMFYGQVATCVR